MDRNDYQNSFFEHIAAIQEMAVEFTLGQHKLYEHEECDKIRSLLYEATSEMVVEMMELIDGYSSFTHDKLDIVNTRTGIGLKQAPFIELHDAVCDFIKLE